MNNQVKHNSNSKKKLNKKCKSQQILKLTRSLKSKQNELSVLKNKIYVSQDILTDIYSKIKRKESMYQLKLAKGQVKCDKLKNIAQQYKNCYHHGLKILQDCLHQKGKRNIQNNLSGIQFKNKILQKIRAKRINQSTQNNQIKQKPNKPKFFEQTQKKAKNNEETFMEGKESRNTGHLSFQNRRHGNSLNKNQKQKFEKNRKQRDQKMKGQMASKTELNKVVNKVVNKSSSLYDQYRSKIKITKDDKSNKQVNGKQIIEQLQQELQQLKIVRKKSQMRLQQNQKQRVQIQQIQNQPKSKSFNNKNPNPQPQSQNTSQDDESISNKIQQEKRQKFRKMQSEKLNKMI